MAGLLDLSAMECLIAACLHGFRRGDLALGRVPRSVAAFFLTGGELGRCEFKSMTGLGDRTAVSALSALVKRGLLKSDKPQGKVRFALPLHALRFYFPALWPEADAQGR